jgi:phosphocarrier protein FPr
MPEYIDGMLAREQSMSTYLGSGVSIPHGLFENREHILNTGISVLQIPAGVVWDEEGEKAHLVIGIAASSDEHVGVLASLAEAIEDEDTTRLLIETTDPNVIMKYLSGSQAE